MQLISDMVEVDTAKGPARVRRYPANPVELFDPEVFTKGPPYENFAWLRANAPVAWNEEPGERAGFWSIARYDDVMRVNGDPETFSSQKGGILMAHGRSDQLVPRRRPFAPWIPRTIQLPEDLHRQLPDLLRIADVAKGGATGVLLDQANDCPNAWIVRHGRQTTLRRIELSRAAG